MNREEQRIRLHARLDTRLYQFTNRIAKLRRWVDSGKEGGEEDRLWLEQFTKPGVGLDICCGDFLIGENSYGIDPAAAENGGCFPLIGANYMFRENEAMKTFKRQEIDYIVCNYFEALSDPLETLQRWRQVLKKDGRVAFLVRDSDHPEYAEGAGPMNNRNRLNCFNRSTIKNYLVRAEFDVKVIEPYNEVIRCMAVVPK
jgi:SAM-dependent methyltransferase